jgi:hypothetical protein
MQVRTDWETLIAEPMDRETYITRVEAFYLALWMNHSDKEAAFDRYRAAHESICKTDLTYEEVDAAWQQGYFAAERLAVQLGYTIF